MDANYVRGPANCISFALSLGVHVHCVCGVDCNMAAMRPHPEQSIFHRSGSLRIPIPHNSRQLVADHLMGDRNIATHHAADSRHPRAPYRCGLRYMQPSFIWVVVYGGIPAGYGTSTAEESSGALRNLHSQSHELVPDARLCAALPELCLWGIVPQ